MLPGFKKQADCLQGKGQNISILSTSGKGKKEVKVKKTHIHIMSDFHSVHANTGIKLAIKSYAYPVLEFHNKCLTS